MVWIMRVDRKDKIMTWPADDLRRIAKFRLLSVNPVEVLGI